ncbi:MAG: RagB/SusD family nutrient uptake outer membrane protein [Terrimonas sp.]|nr:RagB/SusD family nutrient uptake outer membrane protein [Terrimonas sp.]
MCHFNIKHCIVLFLFTCLITTSCKKAIEVDPPINQIVSSEVFKNDSTAKSAVLGIYSEMMRTQAQFCAGQTTLYAGMSANELYFYSPDIRREFVDNEISNVNHLILANVFWNPAYKHIYTTNLCLERLAGSNITPSLKACLRGEALFLRVFCYFHLVNLFGDVPLILTTDYEKNARMPRTPESEVYEQMVTDLTEAAEILPSAYESGTRARVTKWAAKALLARVYLYLKRWDNAEAMASEVINAGLFTLPALTEVFLKTSSETILQLQPVNSVWNTWEGRDILPASANETPKYVLTDRMFQSFETNDNRKTVWVGSRVFNGQAVQYPAKYRVYGSGAPLTEYYIVLRLAEQYLIRAEARTHKLDLGGGLTDLNRIRQRAGLAATAANDTSALLNLLEQERQAELFSEWGHRWYDLKRTGRVNAVMQIINPSTWQSTDALYPIPSGEILLNPSLIQNAGY